MADGASRPSNSHVANQVLELPRRPKKIVIVGGGYIGVEFAGMFSRLGAEVHVIARGPLPLAPRFDKEVCQFALDQYRAAGIHMHMDCSPVEVTRQEPGDATAPDAARAGADADAATNSGGGAAAAAPRRTLSVRVQRQPPKGEEGKSEGQGEEFVIEGCDEVVLAVGRGGKASGIGLEEAGVKFGPKGGVVVDELSRTSVPSIWAIGDVTGRIALTPVATMEGDALAHTLTGAPTRPDHANVPSAVFSLPFIASVGLTEEQAAEKYPRVAVFSKSYTPLREGIAAAGRAAAAAASRGSGAAGGAAAGPLRGLAKVVVDEESDRLLGVHLVGQDAPEAIQGFAVALKAGATKAQLDSTVGVHPTASEELVQMKGPPTRVVGSAARDGSGTGKGQGAEKGEPARAGGARGGEAASAG
ncbi:Glutathione reductase [Monoraphidium neglectum]|uniref:Glutathione reductase n=1 Tax=Monoraphidium neglectum TaxID=145388 RepID=A0A0D2MWJ9_9CHLO|nr:Glutathione reductase [Monoraphidium neglectum]KIZ06930.1 Glutathione reductase [Monoraphidium neglectum]|eukprot:XP_013905949.1 Glutathione reductase [Monoraphidium neglectum]